MKACDLMIGDYLRCKDTGRCLRVMQLTGIVGDYIMLEDGDESDVSIFEPIPLTKEILEKNGFNEFGGVYDFPNNSSFGVMITTVLHKGIYPTYDESAFFLCGYVHELQHALRLCGLNELADNFKV